MKNLFLRQFLPCFTAFLTVVSIAAPAFSETNSAQLLVNQWIRQSEDGSIAGKVVLPQTDGVAVAVSPALIALADSSGDVRNTETDENGAFTFGDVTPGVYTVLTRGAKDVCAIVALHVIAHDDERAAGLTAGIEISAGKVDFSSVNSNLIRYLPPRQFGEATVSVDNVDVNAISLKVAGSAVHRVKQSNGGMAGQIYAAGSVGDALTPSNEANVFLFHEGVEIDRVVTDASGRFVLETVPTGVYSIMVVGNSGSGLVGFELVDDSSRTFASQSAGNQTLVSAVQDNAATQFVLQLAPSEGVVGTFQDMGPVQGEVISDVLIDEEVIGEEVLDDGLGAPMSGGGYSTGGGGSSGGGSGRGLAIAAIGGTVAAIVAASTSDSDRVIVPPPATNAAP